MMDERSQRALSREAAKKLEPGGGHYTSYVGPPDEYDFMGATQFRLLTTLGLREHHAVLDFGCGSLRLGRLLIPYLLPEHYYGLDPNRWLIDDGIAHEVGAGLRDLKRPTFRYDSDFTIERFGKRFDFIVAQSIFSHAGRDVIRTALRSFKQSLAPGGLVLATFILPRQMPGHREFRGDGWIYPGCVCYRERTVLKFARDAGLAARALPWFHPRQTWFVMARTRASLPRRRDDKHLSGVTLGADPEIRRP